MPFGGPTSTAPLLDVEMPKSTCRGPGSFILYDIAFDEPGEKVQRLDVAFEMSGCGDAGDQTVRGRVRFNEVSTGLRARLPWLFPARAPEPEPVRPLDLAGVGEACQVPADRFFCIQGDGRAWVAAGRRQVIIHGKRGVGVYGSLDTRGAVKISTLDVRPSGHTNLSLSFSPRRGTPLTPGLYEELRAGALYENVSCQLFGEEGAYLDISSLNVGANCQPEYRGRFRIRSLAREEDGSIHSIAADFELRTLDGAPVIGRFRITDMAHGDPQETGAVTSSPPAPLGQEPPPPVAEMAPSQRVAVPEADARCSADGRTFERRGDVWMESGTERSQSTVTLTREQDTKFDLMALKARIWTALNLGPKVRAYVDGKVTEILQGNGYPKDPFAGVSCEVFGKVRLPRRITEMGSALDAQLRQDGKQELHVGARFLVDRSGKVSELLAADGLPEKYRTLLLQDLQKMTYMPATLDGKPVPVVQSGTLTY